MSGMDLSDWRTNLGKSSIVQSAIYVTCAENNVYTVLVVAAHVCAQRCMHEKTCIDGISSAFRSDEESAAILRCLCSRHFRLDSAAPVSEELSVKTMTGFSFLLECLGLGGHQLQSARLCIVAYLLCFRR